MLTQQQLDQLDIDLRTANNVYRIMNHNNHDATSALPLYQSIMKQTDYAKSYGNGQAWGLYFTAALMVGECYIEQGDYNSAIILLQKLHSLEPKRNAYPDRLAFCYQCLGDNRNAMHWKNIADSL